MPLAILSLRDPFRIRSSRMSAEFKRGIGAEACFNNQQARQRGVLPMTANRPQLTALNSTDKILSASFWAAILESGGVKTPEPPGRRSIIKASLPSKFIRSILDFRCESVLT